MKVIEDVPIIQTKSVIVARECDICHKRHEGEDIPDDWHVFNHQYHSWNSDNDLFKQHEICSLECYWIKFKECVLDLKGVQHGKVDSFNLSFARKLVNL